MWSSELSPVSHLVGAVGLMMLLASCTIKPLNATRAASEASDNGTSQSVAAVMKTIAVSPVNERVAQQVRNNLMFELNGGQLEPGGNLHLSLKVVTGSRSLAIENNSLSPTSAQVAVTATYHLTNTITRDDVSSGTRRGVASFDKTPQKFANERAQRDAENRAAKDVARQIRLAIGQSLAKQ
ncbi:MAG: hypothetical protein GKR97_05015 [Rhizobiaceae bacterium]|nr:hypothetical protein [Rhizobiaceae bacterium]